MPCGCGQSVNNNSKKETGLFDSVGEYFEGKRKLNLLEAVQLLSGVIVIIGFVKYLSE